MLLQFGTRLALYSPTISLFPMKQLLAQVSGALIASQFYVAKAFGALPDPDPIPGLSTQTNIKGAIVDIIVRVLDFILLIAVVFVIVAGIRLIVSGGSDEQKDKAKKTIIYVIIGIIIVLFARVIVVFVNTVLG